MKLMHLNHLSVKLMTEIVMGACVLHNFALVDDDNGGDDDEITSCDNNETEQLSKNASIY